MKKINQNGFVLAETLVVAVFLMAIFTLIFSNFYPLIGEYEKRETYDDVDGKYAIYWIRRMVEDSTYKLTDKEKTFFNNHGYIRFSCSDIEDTEKRETCAYLVKYLEVKSCNSSGDNCEVYITKYRLSDDDASDKEKYLKYQIRNVKTLRKDVNNSDETTFVNNCKKGIKAENPDEYCKEEANRKEFRSGFKEYIESLPDYKREALDGSKYRIIACFQHRSDNNNYYSYSTMEVSR